MICHKDWVFFVYKYDMKEWGGLFKSNMMVKEVFLEIITKYNKGEGESKERKIFMM